MEENINDIFEEKEQSKIDIRKYLYKGLKYWYLFVIFLPAFYAIAYWKSLQIIPKYGLHSTILIKNDNAEESAAGGLQLFRGNKNLNTQMGALKSYSLNREAIEQLDFGVSYFLERPYRSDKEIYTKSPFVVNFDSAFSQYYGMRVYVNFVTQEKIKISIKNLKFEKYVKLGEQVTVGNFSFNLTARDSSGIKKYFLDKNYFFVKNSLHSVTKNYINALKIEVSPEKSSILWLWLEGSVPEKDANYLNKLIEVYIKKGLDEKNAKADSVIKFIDTKLSDIADSLYITEGSLQTFKEKTKTLDISQEAQIYLQKKEKLRTNLRLLYYKLRYYKNLKETVKQKGTNKTFALPGVMGLSDPILITYIQSLSQAITEREVLDLDVKSTIPATKLLDLKIEKIRNQIYQHAINNINATSEEINTYTKDLLDVNKSISRLPANERSVGRIERKFLINDEIYTNLLTKRWEAAISKASSKADTKLIDKALPQNAVFKGPYTSDSYKKMLLIGLIIPIIIIVLIEYLNNKIEDKTDIEKATKVPIVGMIGRNTNKSNIPTADELKSPISESFRALRTNLQYVFKGEKNKIIAVTSTIGGEGKSFISTNIASILAVAGHRVLLVGLDLRKPKLQKEFEIDKEKGISTYLINENTAEEIIVQTRIKNLSLAYSGPIPPNPAELIESFKMKEFFNKVKQDFDYVVVDTPPVAIVTDALLLSEIADAFLYVVRQNYSNKNALKLINDVASKTNLKNLSIILNDITLSKGYSYNYGYGLGYYGDDESGKKKRLLRRIRRKISKQ